MKIPLNPPFSKGDNISPFCKRFDKLTVLSLVEGGRLGGIYY